MSFWIWRDSISVLGSSPWRGGGVKEAWRRESNASLPLTSPSCVRRGRQFDPHNARGSLTPTKKRHCIDPCLVPMGAFTATTLILSIHYAGRCRNVCMEYEMLQPARAWRTPEPPPARARPEWVLCSASDGSICGGGGQGASSHLLSCLNTAFSLGTPLPPACQPASICVSTCHEIHSLS